MLVTPTGLPLTRIVTTAQLPELGYSPAVARTELRCGRWQTLVRGVHLTRPDPPSRADWIRVGLLLAGPGAALSGWDAVRLDDLGDRRPPIDEVLILCPTGRHRTCSGVHIRPSGRDLTTSGRGVADLGTVTVAAPARAVADTALTYRTLPPVRALVTTAAQRGLCSFEELTLELESGPRNYSALLRRALTDLAAGALSISEAELAELMSDAGLPPFELNVPIYDPQGVHVATADVLWRALRAVLEVDSRQHHFLEPKWRNTMRRHNLLTRFGLVVTHYPPLDIRDRPGFVVDEVTGWLRGRADERGVNYPPPAPALRGQPLHLPLPPRDQQRRDVVC